MDVKKLSGHSEKNSVSFKYKNILVTSIVDDKGVISTDIKTTKTASDWTILVITFFAVILNFSPIPYLGLVLSIFITILACLKYRYMNGNVEFRKMHGAEHMVANLLEHEKIITPQRLSSYSGICSRCGGTVMIFITVLVLAQSVFLRNEMSSMILVPVLGRVLWGFKDYAILRYVFWPVYQASFLVQKQFTVLVPDDLQLEMASITANTLLNEIEKNKM